MNESTHEQPVRRSREWFATTHWSAVLDAQQSDPARARAALERLCHAYWYPLYAFTRRFGKSPEDAEDLIQSFFAACIEKNYLASADREKGRFRSFLLVALKRFLANEYYKGQAARRGGGRAVVSLDALEAEQRYAIEPVDQSSPDKLYERQWALTLLEHTLKRLQQEQEAVGRGPIFNQLKAALAPSGSDTSYLSLAERLGMSEGAIKVAVHRLRQRYRALLEDEIANTVTSPENIEEERRHLLAVLSA